MEAAVRGGVFVDTSGWYASIDAEDPDHAVASARLARLRRERRLLVTTNYVIGETYTLLRRRLGARLSLGFIRSVRLDPFVRRVYVPDNWEEAAEALLQRLAEHEISYVDATSFVAMRELQLQEAFAFDRDFMIAGFALFGDA